MMAFQYLKKSKVRHLGSKVGTKVRHLLAKNVIFGSKPSCGQPSLEDKQYHHYQLVLPGSYAVGDVGFSEVLLSAYR